MLAGVKLFTCKLVLLHLQVYYRTLVSLQSYEKMKLTQIYIDNIINTALAEDINYMDVTTDNLLPLDHTSSAYYVAKDSGVLCGIEIAKRVFELIGGNVDFQILINEDRKSVV